MPQATQPEPDEENAFLSAHARLLVRSFKALTGRDLLAGGPGPIGRRLFHAPFFVASHDAATDPRLTYGNRCALRLFEMDWAEFVGTPSRFTAEEPKRAERARLLERVRADGFIDDYSGVRISKSGRRFRIRRATVWNLGGAGGEGLGQAATFSAWELL